MSVTDQEAYEDLLDEYDELLATVPEEVRRQWWLIVPTMLEATADYTWSSDKSAYELEIHQLIFSAVLKTKPEFEKVGTWWAKNYNRFRKIRGLDGTA